LDYYTKTTFEFVHHGLGAQSGIGGGGRYDHLMQVLGGQDLSGIGFGLGVDRALIAAESEKVDFDNVRPSTVCVIPTSSEFHSTAFKIAAQLRSDGHIVDQVTHTKNLKSGLKVADRLAAVCAVIVGEDEAASGLFAVKWLASGAQQTCAIDGLGDLIWEHLRLASKPKKDD
jgi:histidyl-tRNA synthetase